MKLIFCYRRFKNRKFTWHGKPKCYSKRVSDHALSFNDEPPLRLIDYRHWTELYDRVSDRFDAYNFYSVRIGPMRLHWSYYWTRYDNIQREENVWKQMGR